MPAAWLRPTLLALAVLQLVTGFSILLAPGEFYDAVADFGPRNDHLLRDTGTASFATGIALALAAGRPTWRVPVLALTAIQVGLHAANHLLDVGAAESDFVGWFDFVSLAAVAAVLVLALRTASRHHETGR